MKTMIAVATLFLLTLFVSCSEDSSNAGTPSVTPPPSYNPSGVYNGAWRFVGMHQYEYNEISYDDPSKDDFYDEDSIRMTVSDTSVLLVIKDDSVTLYEYETGDSYTIEKMVWTDLDEYDTVGRLDSLRIELEGRLMTEMITLSNYDPESIDSVGMINDTLVVQFGYVVDTDFSAVAGSETITGAVENGAASIYKLVEYSGTVPPASWPNEYSTK